MLSVILPAYNEDVNIRKSARVIGDILKNNNIDYCLIYVDDGSKDRTWENIVDLTNHDNKVQGLRFSRNFGKESAILAGLSCVKGQCAVVMDCDLQHPPEKIVEMYNLWEKGYKVISGIKTSRGKEAYIHSIFANGFYKLMDKATNLEMDNSSDFKLLDRQVIDIILSMPEQNMFFRAISQWVGFKSTSVEFEVKEREEGESKWSKISLIKYAIRNIASFSSLPMQIVTFLGIMFFAFGTVIGVQSLVRYFMGDALEGFTTVILLILFVGGVLMISLGIIGYYISKIYEEVKNRPRYIIAERIEK